MKGEKTMEKALEMLVEYILERCTGLETENRMLNKGEQRLKDQVDHYLNDNIKQAEKLAELKKEFASDLTWADGKPTGMYISTRHAVRICEILRIEEHDKTSC